MNLIFDHWRLKLLAIGLAVVMLGAVALYQNPLRSKTVTVGVDYSYPVGLILINPPSKVTVTVSGLADVIASVTPDNMFAVVDAKNVSPGHAGCPNTPCTVKLDVKVAPPSGVSVQSPAPIAVNVDVRQSISLPVAVVARPAPGWSITKAAASCPDSPCTVTFDGPASWETNLVASVVYGNPVNIGSIHSPSQPVQLQNSTGTLDLSAVSTRPLAALDVTTAFIDIEARPGSTSSTVPLVDAPPSQPPPAGYRLTAIVVSPITVIITGDAGALGRIQRILLQSIDLSGHVSDFTIQVPIQYPNGVNGTVVNATITFSISPNPNVSPNP
jgi:YbbR domain-containing protein